MILLRHMDTPKPRKQDAASSRSSHPANPFIFTSKTAYMQRIGDAVRAGALHYINGTIKLNKAPFLVQKFAARYLVNAPRMQDMRARKAGEDTARWLAWMNENSGLVEWFLFYAPGKTICREERWKQPWEDRIHLTGYELVRLTKPGAKAPVITWRYTRDRYRELHDQIVFAIRGRQDVVLEQLNFSLSKSPGFAGVRDQVKGLWKITKNEWKRRRAKEEVMPPIPQNIGYVRRLPDVGLLWSELMKNQTKKGVNDGSEPTQSGTRKARKNSILVQPGLGGASEKP